MSLTKTHETNTVVEKSLKNTKTSTRTIVIVGEPKQERKSRRLALKNSRQTSQSDQIQQQEMNISINLTKPNRVSAISKRSKQSTEKKSASTLQTKPGDISLIAPNTANLVCAFKKQDTIKEKPKAESSGGQPRLQKNFPMDEEINQQHHTPSALPHGISAEANIFTPEPLSETPEVK